VVIQAFMNAFMNECQEDDQVAGDQDSGGETIRKEVIRSRKEGTIKEKKGETSLRIHLI
jgi:hypothetical protein